MERKRSSNTDEPEWKITAAFLKSTPESMQIRNLCIAFYKLLNQLLISANNDSTLDGEIYIIYVNIRKITKIFEEKGISKQMHLGQELEFFKDSPQAVVEFVAGQLLNILNLTVPSVNGVFEALANNSDNSGRRMQMMELSQVSQGGIDFLAYQSALSIASGMLCIGPKLKKVAVRSI